jgi:hypothetical protein
MEAGRGRSRGRIGLTHKTHARASQTQYYTTFNYEEKTVGFALAA